MDGRTFTQTAITHYGDWNDDSRAIPALNFFEKYDATVIKCDFSGPYHDWFAPSAKFYTNIGDTYQSGSDIWEWMKSPALFGNYQRLVPEHRVSTVILNGHQKGDRLIHQQDMVFFPKYGQAKDKGITVRRTIEFVSGPSELEGQGVDGLQYYVGKTFWDTGVLNKAAGVDSVQRTMSRSELLLSLNKTPARAAFLVAQLFQSVGVEDRVAHFANASNSNELAVLLQTLVRPPRYLICSSQWTEEEQTQANKIAQRLVPDIHIINIPPGLDEREGGEGVVRYLQTAFTSAFGSVDGSLS